MTLTTHAIVGAAAASLFPQAPVAAFAAGFTSHFVIDSIPHWNEAGALMRSFQNDPADKLNTDMRLGKDFLHDLAVLAVDAGLGIALGVILFSLWLFHAPLYIVLIGAGAGILPDPLQFVYFKTRWKFMRPLQRFHSEIQTEILSFFSIGIEIALIILIVAALKLFT